MAGLAVLLFLVFVVWRALGEPCPWVFWIAVGFPVVHQVFVWLAWRVELLNSATSRAIGFPGYVVVFFILFGGRFISLIALGWLDRDSLQLWMLPRVLMASLFVIVGLYAMYSVQRYFGMMRASGADHFDTKYREMPLVNKGIFRYTDNGMYVYAFLLFWAIGIGFDSSAATEKPDMRFLYSTGSKPEGA